MTEPHHPHPRQIRRFKIALMLLGMVAASALLIAGGALYSRFDQTNQIRAASLEAINANKHAIAALQIEDGRRRHVWHAVVCSIEGQIIKAAHLTAAEKQTAYRFYDHLLIHDVKTTGCGLESPKG